MTLDSFRRRLRVELRERQHVDSEEVVNLLLTAFIALYGQAPDKVEALNAVLESIEPVEVSHFGAYPSHPVNWYGNWKGWRWGLLNSDLLKSRCRRAGSNYWELWGSRLESVCTVQSPDFERRVVNWTFHVVAVGRGNPGTHEGDMILNYFECLTRTYEEMAWRDLDERQSILTPFDLDVLRLSYLKDIPFVHKVTVYMGFTKPVSHGYVCPIQTAPHVNWMPPDGDPLLKAREFEAQYALEKLPQSELAAVIRSVCKYAQMAQTCLRQREFSDALLNSIIALEILFSERDSATDAISSRTAAVIHRGFEKPFADVRNEISKLYDERSNFVHKGKPASADGAERSLPILQQVLLALFRLNKIKSNHESWTHNGWIKQLDWVRASIEAGIPVPEDALQAAGIRSATP
jgi:hypothetical protein